MKILSCVISLMLCSLSVEGNGCKSETGRKTCCDRAGCVWYQGTNEKHWIVWVCQERDQSKFVKKAYNACGAKTQSGAWREPHQVRLEPPKKHPKRRVPVRTLPAKVQPPIREMTPVAALQWVRGKVDWLEVTGSAVLRLYFGIEDRIAKETMRSLLKLVTETVEFLLDPTIVIKLQEPADQIKALVAWVYDALTATKTLEERLKDMKGELFWVRKIIYDFLATKAVKNHEQGSKMTARFRQFVVVYEAYFAAASKFIEVVDRIFGPEDARPAKLHAFGHSAWIILKERLGHKIKVSGMEPIDLFTAVLDIVDDAWLAEGVNTGEITDAARKKLMRKKRRKKKKTIRRNRKKGDDVAPRLISKDD